MINWKVRIKNKAFWSASNSSSHIIASCSFVNLTNVKSGSKVT
ncbi:phage holin [Streptococcus agalactiae]